jgi:hypothetical protein
MLALLILTSAAAIGLLAFVVWLLRRPDAGFGAGLRRGDDAR